MFVNLTETQGYIKELKELLGADRYNTMLDAEKQGGKVGLKEAIWNLLNRVTAPGFQV